MTQYKKTPPLEIKIFSMLKSEILSFPPLKIIDVQRKPLLDLPEGMCSSDGYLTFHWQGEQYDFVVKYKSRSNPKAIEVGANQVVRAAEFFERYPLLIVPYLSNKQLSILEQRGISALDLCGNGVITIPDQQLLVLRSGEPNQYRMGGAIKNVYRKNSAIAARVFLLVPEYDSLEALREEIYRRDGQLGISTISKVCTALANDLIIERFRAPNSRSSNFRLLQPDMLLDRLVANYKPPAARRGFTGKAKLPPDELIDRLAAWSIEKNERVALTGSSSTGSYAIMAREKRLSFYCTDLPGALKTLGETVEETTRFDNLELIETEDDFVYFDLRDRLVASPIQTYLELSQGDKRERETAEQVRKYILSTIGQQEAN